MTENQKSPSGFMTWAKAHPVRATVILPAFLIVLGGGFYFAVADMIAKGKWILLPIFAAISARGGLKAYRKLKHAQSSSEISERFL